MSLYNPASIHEPEPCPGCEEQFLDNGRRCGWWLCGPCRALLRRHQAKHVLQRPKGLAFDLALWERVREFVDHIVCVETDGDAVRVSTRDEVDAYGFEINRGFGRQVVLTLDHWEDVSQPQLQPAMF